MVVVSFFFYKKYFVQNEVEKLISTEIDRDINSKNTDNLISKFKYEVKLVDNGRFEIKAESSKVETINDGEDVSMNDVEAIFIDEINREIKIRSNKANFNTTSNNINFFGNIEVKYLNNLILANKLDFNYKNNNIKIHENIFYKGSYGSVQADNIEINLTTRNLRVFMDNQNDRIKIISNR
jgi:lipopolysaccharide assembly outer membrane protein LptD (OstA)